MTQTKPLAGIKVLDLTRVLSGPYCAQMLFDMGAEVLKIENPIWGDDSRLFQPHIEKRSLYFEFINGGKKSLTLNFKNPKAVDIFKKLIADADVLVENFRPGIMKKFGLDFMRRGLFSLGFGPLVLAVIYFILGKAGTIEFLSVGEVCIGIFSLSALAFFAGALTSLYQIERLPLMPAIFIHGAALYLGYLGTYLANGWLSGESVPVLVFSGIFVLGYALIWCMIYFATRKSTKKINRLLEEKQKNAE
jgi:hypothetical protein